jgi:hypothetical protein
MMNTPPEKRSPKESREAARSAQKAQKAAEKQAKAAAKAEARAKKNDLVAQKKNAKPAKPPVMETIKSQLPAINYEFSKREKTMLYVLGIFLLVLALFFWAFVPGLNTYQNLVEQRDEARLTKQTMEMSIASLSSNQALLTKQQTNLSAKQAAFAAKMNSAQLDAFVTTFLVNSGLVPKDLSIDKISTDSLASYNVTSLGGSSSSSSSSGSSSSGSSSSGDISNSATSTTTTDNSSTTSTDVNGTTTGVVTGTVTVTFTGGIAAVEAMMDNAAARTDLQVMALSYNNSATQQGGSVTLNVYMAYQGDTTNAVSQTQTSGQ